MYVEGMFILLYRQEYTQIVRHFKLTTFRSQVQGATSYAMAGFPDF